MWFSRVLSWNDKAVIKVLAKAVVSSEGMAVEGPTFSVAQVVVGRT